MFSVGILYASQDFLNLVYSQSGIDNSFPETFTEFSVASPSIVMNLCEHVGWVALKNNKYEITETGREILDCSNPYKALRIQIGTLIEKEKPVWLPLLSRGRSEASKYFSNSIFQCFNEAELFSSLTDEIIAWWDKYINLSYEFNSSRNLNIGRKGERLTIAFERKRTVKEPVWQGFESNLVGYDILSVTDVGSSLPLLIEVKTSDTHLSSAAFFLSRNELEVALTSPNYLFYLWCLHPGQKLFIVRVEDILKHIPNDTGSGKWENVKISYAPFIQYCASE